MQLSSSTAAVVVLAGTALLALAAIVTRPDAGPGVDAPTAAEVADGAAPVATPTVVPTPTQAATSSPDAPATDPAAAIPVLGAAPPLVQLDGWLQTDTVDDLDDLRGKVVVVQFWTFSCSNCKATLPNLRALRDAHADDDRFAIVGVHYPEFTFEEDPDAILAAAADLDVTWPIALDTRGRSFHSWQEGSTGYWPRTYVLDADGNIRFDHIGEGKYDELNETVAALLAAT